MSSLPWWDRPHIGRWLLLPLSLLYGLGWAGYSLLYRLGIKRPKRLHPRVICVGNYRVGGTGKTPFVRWLAYRLHQAGEQVVISTSGYGSPSAEAAQIAPDGPLDAAKWGDEAALLRLSLPDTPLIVGRRRTLAAELCQQAFPESLLLLDDGFQHLPLAKDVTIVLDPPSPNPSCLPAGPYREPRWFRNRASLVLPSREFHLRRVPTTFGEPDKVVDFVLCGIAQPKPFLAESRQNGFSWEREVVLQDHATAGEIPWDSLPQTRGVALCTAKDWVKIRDLPTAQAWKWVVVDYDHEVVEGEELIAWVLSKLGKTADE